MWDLAEGNFLAADAVYRGRAALCGEQSSFVTSGVRSLLSRSAGNWRLNVFPLVCIVKCL